MEKRSFKFFILHSLARQLQSWADFMANQAKEEERTIQPPQARTKKGSMEPSSAVSQTPLLEGSAHADGPPAHWLARVQKDAPELLKDATMHSRTLPAAQNPDTTLEVDTEQEAWVAEIVHAEKNEHSVQSSQVRTARIDTESIAASSSAVSSPIVASQTPLLEGSMDADGPPAHWLARVQRDIPERPREKRDFSWNGPTQSVSNTQARDAQQKSRITKRDQPDGEESKETGGDTGLELGRHLLPLQDSRQNPSGEQDSSPWQKRARLYSSQPVEQNRQLQVNLAAPAHDEQSPSAIGKHIQTEMRWPSLSDEVTNNDPDWEMARRHWERQQRLDEEQRGRSWNA